MDIRKPLKLLSKTLLIVVIAVLGFSQLSWADSLAADGFEVNDTEGTGTEAILPFSAQGLTIHNGSDDDFFQIDLVAGQRIVIDALFNNEPYNASEDLEIRLIPPNGSGGGNVDSASKTSNEKISHVALFTGTYFLQVRGFGMATNTYDLSIYTVDPPEFCLPIISRPGAVAVICL